MQLPPTEHVCYCDVMFVSGLIQISMNESNTHPVVAFNQRWLFWSGREHVYHGCHRVGHLSDVTALFLPAGEPHGQDLFRLETPQKERAQVLNGL